MQVCASIVAVVLAASPAMAWAGDVKSDLHGIALGMTMEEAKAAAALPCETPPFSSDMACRDAADGSDYHATLSAGTPSVVLTVERSFCAHATPAAVLEGLAAAFGASRAGAQADPNGYHVDLDQRTELILNADDGTCPDGRGKHYVASLRGNGLITSGSDQARDRMKKALR